MIPGILELIVSVLNRVVPDKTQQDKIKVELAKLAMEGELKKEEQKYNLLISQSQVNANEAQNSNLFVSGWRSFIGWGLGSALLWNLTIEPILSYLIILGGGNPPNPIGFNINLILKILLGMLGLS